MNLYNSSSVYDNAYLIATNLTRHNFRSTDVNIEYTCLWSKLHVNHYSVLT